MSFIDVYMKKHRVGKITNANKKNIKKLEDKLSSITKQSKLGLSFLDTIRQHGGQLGDLIERIQQHFDEWKFTWKNTFSAFQFVYSIATEVYQIVDTMHDEIVPTGATPEEAKEIKRTFGKNLVYFVWKTIDPLGKAFRWIPFKKTIEKKLVLWLAGLGLDAAQNLFKANKEVASFSVNNNQFMKAL